MRDDYGYFEEDHLVQVGEVRLWRRILAYVAPYWPQISLAVLLSLIITGTSLALPYIVRLGIDDYITNQELPPEARFGGLARIGGLFVGLIVLEFVVSFLQVVVLEWCGQRIMHRLRQQLFGHLLSLDLTFFNRNPVGRLVTRLTNDIQNMHEMFTSVIVTIFNDMVRLVGIMAVLFWMNHRLALILCLLVPVIIAGMAWFSRLARDAFREIRTQLAKLNSFLQEALSGMAVIQLFRREVAMGRRFAEISQLSYLKALRQIKIFGIFMPAIEVLGSLSIGLIIWYGGGQIIRGAMTLGVLVAFISYMRLFFQPLRELSQKYSIVQSALASAERIFQLLDTTSALPRAGKPLRPESLRGEVRFDKVSFGYEPGRPVLHDFDLTVRPGETVAIVGATGSGKTTLINLLERFYDPAAGRVLLDGRDLREYSLTWLRSRIGLVMQEVLLVPASIRENILLGEQLDESRLAAICRRAQLDEVLATLAEGVETRVGEGGQGLSAGQKQLLAFARVLARDPQILVLDEATANVDSQTEGLIEQALEGVLTGRTSIIIAHRLSTVRRAHRIIVMEQGRIVEQGSHRELLDRGGAYAALQRMQFNGCRDEGTADIS